MIRTLLIIGFGGAIGSMLRYLTSVIVNKYWAFQFPMATFLINGIGCFLIGYCIGTLEKHGICESQWKGFLITGFCGGFTTFSAFGLENLDLIRSQQSLIAFAYIGLSVIVGLLAVWLGLFVTKL